MIGQGDSEPDEVMFRHCSVSRACRLLTMGNENYTRGKACRMHTQCFVLHVRSASLSQLVSEYKSVYGCDPFPQKESDVAGAVTRSPENGEKAAMITGESIPESRGNRL